MDLELVLDPEDIQRAGHVAATIRRRAALGNGATPGAMHERITFLPSRPYQINESPWWRIGTVVDEIESYELAVWCDPVKRVIRVQTPEDAGKRFVVPKPAEMFPMVPGSLTPDPRYRYFCKGVEYSAEVAGKMVAGNGAFQWTWELKAPKHN